MIDDRLFPTTSMPDRDWWSALWPRPEETLRALGIKPQMTVLDLCCGDGYFTAPLSRIVGGKVYGLDIDCAMIEVAKAEVARQGASVGKWICADAMALASHLVERVDYVLMANTFHGVPDQAALAHAVRGVLRPWGTFAVVNWYPAERDATPVLGEPRGPKAEMRMSPQAVAKVVEPVGFRMATVVALPPYHYGALFEALVHA
jgi:ubiquinone/menaquinone biosynthesis C-methylase UbiE